MDNETKVKEIEISKVKLEPGQILVVKVYSDDTSQYDLASLKNQLKIYFPFNKIMLFALPIDGRIEMDVLETARSPLISSSSCAEPTSYCNDCSCGKKERIEGSKNE